MPARLTEQTLQAYCLSKPGAWPDNPWEHEHPVIKVGSAQAAGRIFAFLGASSVGVKAGATRDEADESSLLVVSRLPRRHRPDGWDQP
jgi:predicted DNA-binding protein (MmcQ/YjbR family)